MATAIPRGSWTLGPIATTFTYKVVIVVLVALCAGPPCGKDAREVAASSLATMPHELIAERVSAGLNQSHCLDQCNMNGIEPTMCTCRASEQECRAERDCCANLFFEEVRRPRLACVPAFGQDVLAVVRCPDSWSPASDGDETKLRCEDEKRENLELSYLDDLPVLSLRSGVMYRNAYCASCNGDTRNLRPWELWFQCSDIDATEALENGAAGEIKYVSNHKSVEFWFEGGERLAQCKITISEMQNPDFAEELNVTECKQLPLVMTCPEDYSNADVRVKCHSYASMVENTDTMDIYRNLHCAICNGVSPKDLSCHSLPQLGPDKGRPSTMGPSYAIDTELPPYKGLHSIPQLGPDTGRNSTMGLSYAIDVKIHPYKGLHSILELDSPSYMGAPYAVTMKFSNWEAAVLSVAPMENVCGRDELHDPVSNRCIKFGCPADVCVKHNDCKWTRVTNDKVHVREDSFLVINSSSEELEPDRWHRDGPNAVMTCVSTTDDATPLRPVEFEDVLSTILLLISVVCLILHVIAYALLPKLRTRPARLVLFLALSVLVAQGSFVAGGLLSTPGSISCRVCSVVSHGSHLAAFFWMNVIAIDVHLTFCKGISGSSRVVRAFPAYSAYAWLSPTLLVAAASTLEYLLPESPWSPSYGSPHCWINRPLSLIAFFGAPLLLLLLSNTVFFLLTARSIHHTSKQTKLARSACAGPSNEQRRLTLYAKLAGVLGLTWAFGFAASLTGLNAFWYPFIVLCGLQGAFIFLAFTFKRSVYRMVRERLCGRPSGRLRGMGGASSTPTTALLRL